MLNDLDILMSGHHFKKLYLKKYEDIIKKYDLKKIEIEILYFISYSGEHNTAKDIANIQCISKAHVSNSIENLTQKKYLTVIEDPDDRRYNHLILTALGKQIIIEIEVVRMQIMKIMFNNVSLEEQEFMLKISKKIINNIGDEIKRCY